MKVSLVTVIRPPPYTRTARVGDSASDGQTNQMARLARITRLTRLARLLTPAAVTDDAVIGEERRLGEGEDATGRRVILKVERFTVLLPRKRRFTGHVEGSPTLGHLEVNSTYETK